MGIVFKCHLRSKRIHATWKQHGKLRTTKEDGGRRTCYVWVIGVPVAENGGEYECKHGEEYGQGTRSRIRRAGREE